MFRAINRVTRALPILAVPAALTNCHTNCQGNESNKKNHGPLKIFSGNAHPVLAKEIASIIGQPLGDILINNFNCGETQCLLKEGVRDCDVFIIQPTCNPSPNQYLMELLIMIDACRRAGANRITAVVPLFGYARQDKKDKSRAPITGKLVADMIQLAGADRVITVDLHASQIQGFVTYPIENMYGTPILTDFIRNNVGAGEDVCVVSPDACGAKRAEGLASVLKSEIAIFSKSRKTAGIVDKMTLTGDVKGKICILVDDIADTASTLCKAADQLMEHGAKEVHVAVIHGVFSDPALTSIEHSRIKQLIVTDTIGDVREKAAKCSKITVLSVAPLLAATIKAAHNGDQLSTLFTQERFPTTGEAR